FARRGPFVKARRLRITTTRTAKGSSDAAAVRGARRTFDRLARPLGLCLVLCAGQSAATSRQHLTEEPSPIELRIGLLRGGSYDVVAMPLEAYVARVVAGEAAPRSAPAALEALAIAVRTFALANRGRHGADRFDLCDQTHCQVMRAATAATEQAAQNTRGR